MNRENNMHIYIDMDGVVADFVAGACRVHGRTISEEADADTRDFYKSWLVTDNEIVQHCMTTEEFWSPINALGAKFWEDLPVYPWAVDLVAYCEGLVGDSG